MCIRDSACIDRKDGRAGKAKEVVLLEILRNGLMHIPELTPVALIKNDNNSLIKNAVSGVLFDESCQLLDGGNDDLGVVIFQPVSYTHLDVYKRQLKKQVEEVGGKVELK